MTNLPDLQQLSPHKVAIFSEFFVSGQLVPYFCILLPQVLGHSMHTLIAITSHAGETKVLYTSGTSLLGSFKQLYCFGGSSFDFESRFGELR